jgi:hypothetical protein
VESYHQIFDGEAGRPAIRRQGVAEAASNRLGAFSQSGFTTFVLDSPRVEFDGNLGNEADEGRAWLVRLGEYMD